MRVIRERFVAFCVTLSERWNRLRDVQKIAVLLAMAVLALTFTGAVVRRKVVAANAYFCGAALGGLSPDEASGVVSRKIEEIEKGSMVFVAGDRQVRIDASELNLVVDRNVVRRALNDLVEDKPAVLPGFVWKIGPRTVMAAPARVESPTPGEVLGRIAQELSCPPLPGTYTFSGRELTPVPPRAGQVVTEEDVREALLNISGPVVNVRFSPIPAPSQQELVLLAEWSTRYDPSEKDRTVNLELSARAICGTVLQPGEVFSFNEVVGPRTPERGYRFAPVVVGDRLQDDIGGGICQVSTTLFNAAALAGLEFREWRNHGIPVEYADPGRDAAVAWGYLDLKIRNNLQGPVVFGVWVEDGLVTARVYGPPSPFRYELIPVVLEEHRVPGKRPGLLVQTYRLTKEGTTVVATEVLCNKTCRYLPSVEEGR